MARLNIEAHLHRFVNGSSKFREVVWVRHYKNLDTATSRGMFFLLTEGEVGDVIEYTLKINGYQVGTMKYHATGKVTTIWNKTAADKLRNKKMMDKANPDSLLNYLSANALQVH